MDPIEKLSSLFEKFPGIGPRQAGRFVQYLLRSSPALRKEFVEAMQSLGGAIRQCAECMRYHAGSGNECSMCVNPDRNDSQLAVVATDTDLAALDRSGTYRGKYFVLGGTISLASEKTSGLRLSQLLSRIATMTDSEEVILAFPANPEGDATTVRIREEIVATYPQLKVSTLGRGLSTGSELEYADPETIKSALDSRR